MTNTDSSQSLNVLVIGATGNTGHRIVRDLLGRNHRVTAFARRPETLDLESPWLTRIAGDALNLDDVRRAVSGQDAICVALGNRHHPLRVRLGITTDTPHDVRSRGTGNVIRAMREHGVSRLLVQTTYGVGESEGKLPLVWRLVFSLLLKPQIDDTRAQEQLVRSSKLDWTLIQPVSLTDEAEVDAFASTHAVAPKMHVSRDAVAQFFCDALGAAELRHATVALSAA